MKEMKFIDVADVPAPEAANYSKMSRARPELRWPVSITPVLGAPLNLSTVNALTGSMIKTAALSSNLFGLALVCACSVALAHWPAGEPG